MLNIMPPGNGIMQSSITNEVSKARHLHHVIRYMGSEKTVYYHLDNSAHFGLLRTLS